MPGLAPDFHASAAAWCEGVDGRDPAM